MASAKVGSPKCLNRFPAGTWVAVADYPPRQKPNLRSKMDGDSNQKGRNEVVLQDQAMGSEGMAGRMVRCLESLSSIHYKSHNYIKKASPNIW